MWASPIWNIRVDCWQILKEKTIKIQSTDKRKYDG